MTENLLMAARKALQVAYSTVPEVVSWDKLVCDKCSIKGAYDLTYRLPTILVPMLLLAKGELDVSDMIDCVEQDSTCNHPGGATGLSN
jgi:hypothetical protein